MQWVGLGVTVGMGGENIQMSSANYTLTKSATNYLSCRREGRQHDAQPASAEGDQGEQEENGGQQRQQQQQEKQEQGKQ